MSDPFFETSPFEGLDRLQRQLNSLFWGAGSPARIRAARQGAFPAINIGSTDEAIEIVAFAPGLDPAAIELSIDKGLLTLSGTREIPADTRDEGQTVHARERFSGAFRRVIELPQHADADQVEATYIDGCLRVTIKKREASKPQRILVQ